MAMSAAMPGIAILDADGRLLAWNAAFEHECAGAPQSPRRGMSLAALEPPCVTPAPGPGARILVRDGRLYRVEEVALPSGGMLRASRECGRTTGGEAVFSVPVAESELSPCVDDRDGFLLAHLSVDDLRILADDVTDLIRAEDGAPLAPPEPFDMVDLVESAVAPVAGLARRKALRLDGFVAPDLRTSVLGDAGCLRRILCHLAANAVKFTDAGSVSVEAVPVASPRRRADATSWRRVRFQVTDTGSGVPATGADRLFDRFVQADPPTVQRSGGFGLGLAVCRALATRIGGRIGLERRPQGGTLAWLEVDLPVLAAPWRWRLSDAEADARALLVDLGALAHADLLRQLQALEVPVGEVADMRLAAREMAEARAIGMPYRIVVVDAGQAARSAAHGAALSAALRAAVPGETRMVLLADSASPADAPWPDWADDILARPIRLQQLLDCLRSAGDRGAGLAPALHAGPLAAARAATADLPAGSLGDPSGNEPAWAPARPPLQILLVEDNPMSLRVMQAFLSRPCFRADVATDGVAAVDAVAGGTYDVVLLDLRIPGFDGFEVTRRIRALDGPQRDVHIIAVTADVAGQVQRQCRAVGMNDYLAKPLRLSVLEERLAALPRPAIAAVPGVPAQAVNASSGAGRSRSPGSR